jgi:hypothetical protein
VLVVVVSSVRGLLIALRIMARQGRCNAMLAVALLLVSSAAVAHGATYIVGDSNHWEVPGEGGSNKTYLNDWLVGKSFVAGDSVVFTYTAGRHNVLTVNADAYTACTLTTPLVRSTTGNDSLILVAGPNYYICGIPGHCSGGQKINITAAASTATPPTAATPPATPTTPTPPGSNAAGTGVSVLYVLAAAVVAAVALW